MEAASLPALELLDLKAATFKPLDVKPAAPPDNDDRRPPEQVHLALGNMNHVTDEDGALVVTRVGPSQPQYTVSSFICSGHILLQETHVSER